MTEKVVLRKLEESDVETLERWLNAPHVNKWFSPISGWLNEVAGRHGEYNWIHHFIAELDGRRIGFCQYYDYSCGGENMHGTRDASGAYSIDYLVGETDCLRCGLGRIIVKELVSLVFATTPASTIFVQPNLDNIPSAKTLLSAGFQYDRENNLYVIEKRG